MIKNLLLVGMVFYAIHSISQTTVFQSSNDYSSWMFVDADTDTYNWMIEDGTLYGAPLDVQGNMLVSFSKSQIDGALTPDNWAIAPVVDASGFENLSLSWKRAFGSYPSPQDKYSVYIVQESDASNLLNTLNSSTSLFDEVGTIAYQLETISMDASMFDGLENLYIAIRHHDCTDKGFLVLDDFELVGEEMSSKLDDLQINVAIFPNPMNDELSVKSTEVILDIILSDINGKTLKSEKVNELFFSIDVSEFMSGIYFVEVITPIGAKKMKVIKK